MAVSLALLTENIEEGLNEVFFDTFNVELPPDYATLDDIFDTNTSKKHAEYDLEMGGVGRFRSKGEEEDIFEDTIGEGYKTTYIHSTFANSVGFTKELLEDEQYNTLKDEVKDLAAAARDTMMANGFSIFRTAFNTSYPGADGLPLISGTHPRRLSTLNNFLTDKLSPASLNQAIVMMQVQKGNAGRFISNVPDILLVPPQLYKLAVEITEAELISQSANNDPNVFSKKYGIRVKQTPYIGSFESGLNGNTPGNDDSWFLLAKNHKIKRWVRAPLETWVTDWQASRKNVTYYNARFRESYGFSSPLGIVGSNGTTGSY